MSKLFPVFAASTLVVTVGLSSAARAVPAVGLLGGTSLFSFDTAAPNVGGTPVTISNLGRGEQILAIDYRPATGGLYGLSTASTLYTLDASTGSATFASQLSTAIGSNLLDISFNPTVDRLRVVDSTGQNLRVNVDSGAATIDGMLAYAATDVSAGTTPSVVGAAYTNQVAGATSTTLYDLDASRNLLDTQAPPNNGTLNTVGSHGVNGLVSFDIDGRTGVAYAATASTLYQLNLTTGATTPIGAFSSASVSDFALTPVPEPMSLGLLGAGFVSLALMRRSRGGVSA